MILTRSEIEEAVLVLFDCRAKLLWLVDQEPYNDVQREFIENGKALLEQTNQMLRDFNVELPS